MAYQLVGLRIPYSLSFLSFLPFHFLDFMRSHYLVLGLISLTGWRTKED